MRLHLSEELPACGAFDAGHVFHDENARLKMPYIAEEFLIEIASRVIDQPASMVCAVHLPDDTESLARGTTHNQVNLCTRR
jgi:hypothetical protein